MTKPKILAQPRSEDWEYWLDLAPASVRDTPKQNSLVTLSSKMKIYEGIDKFTGAKNPAVTIGTFDRVHLGHQKIIRKYETCKK